MSRRAFVAALVLLTCAPASIAQNERFLGSGVLNLASRNG
jgi:hypothetical protein